MKKILIALLSTLTMNANVHSHSILPPPSEEVTLTESISLISNLTYENFISINKIEVSNVNCAEEAWDYGTYSSGIHQLLYGCPLSDQEIYNITNAYYNRCITGMDRRDDIPVIGSDWD